MAATSRLFAEKAATLEVDLPDEVPRDPRRPGPPRAGRDQPPLERGEVLRRHRRPGRDLAPRAARRDPRRRARQRAGIAPKDQEVIFEKFRQAGDTLTAKPRGTGLGLRDQPRDHPALRRPPLGRERAREGCHVLVRHPARPAGRGERRRRGAGGGEPEALGAPNGAGQGALSGASMPKKVLIADDEPNIVMSLQFLMEAVGVRGADRGRRRGGAPGAPRVPPRSRAARRDDAEEERLRDLPGHPRDARPGGDRRW